MTVDGSNRYGLVTSFISKFYKSGTGQDIREPLHTVTTSPGHFGEVRAFLTKYYGAGTGQDIKAPLDTITAQDRFGLVTIYGTEYQIVDIGLRMLEPKELYGCQGFPDPVYCRKQKARERYRKLLAAKETELLELTTQAEEYIETIQSSELRIMFRLYFIDGLSDPKVAYRMNRMFPNRRKKYTDENVKKRRQRFFEKIKNVPQCPDERC